jgi:hypothetical protein
MLERHPCMQCNLSALGIFFHYSSIRDATLDGLTGTQPQLKCLGCLLTLALNTERDHYKRFKRNIISKWLRLEDDPETDEPVWNTNNMSLALSDFETRNVVSWARDLDRRRVMAMLHPKRPEDALDRENDEVQRPFTRVELGRLGMKNRSPTVQSKDEVIDQWNWVDTSRLWAHGHGVPH